MRREPSITLFTKWTAVCVSPLLFGLVLTLFGKSAGTILFVSPRRLSGAGWLLIVACTGLGFLVYYWLQAALESQGYTQV